MTGGGQPIPAGLSYPPPKILEQWLFTVNEMTLKYTLLKMMKFSYNPNIFCLFSLISQLKYLRWWVGGNLSQLVSCPPPRFFEQWLAMDSELLLIALTTINGYGSQNACKHTTKQFLKFIHLLVGGNISQLVYLTPHPRFWSSDCLHIMKWLWSITLLKMMKISYNPDIFCLFTLISHLKYLRWWVGGNLSQLVYLAPHPDFWAVIGYGFWIAVYCFYNY